MARIKLVIFDLDQTLVDFISVHNEVTHHLFREFFKVETRLTDIDFAGKSLNDIFTELARLKNVPEETFRNNRAKLLESYGDTFSRRLPSDAKKYILPGVRELLEKLVPRSHLVFLYTGGSRRIVDTVLKATNLEKYFRFCFYGTEAATRVDMVRQAIEKSREIAGREFRGRDIVIVGDSIRDVECGKPFGALTIAVATGFHSPEKLKAAGADIIFPSLENSDEVLKAIEQP